MKPGDLVYAAVSAGGEDIRTQGFEMADSLLDYIAEEIGPVIVTDPAIRGAIFRALTAAFCGGYLRRPLISKDGPS